MNDTHRKSFYVVMKGCSEIYRQDLSDAIVSIFWEILKNHDIEIVKNAFSRYLKNPKNDFFPKPAQIIEEIEGKKEHKSLEAWSKAVNAVNEKGYNLSVLFDDEIIHQVIKDFGGWIDFCEIVKNIKGLSFTSKEFRERYNMYLDGAFMNPSPYLIGIHEKAQTDKKFIASPVLIGDPEKAKNIYLKLMLNKNDARNEPYMLVDAISQSFNTTRVAGMK